MDRNISKKVAACIIALYCSSLPAPEFPLNSHEQKEREDKHKATLYLIFENTPLVTTTYTDKKVKRTGLIPSTALIDVSQEYLLRGERRR